MLDIFLNYDGKKVNNKIPVVGYCRFSSDNQREGNSIEAQRFAIEKFCNENNLWIATWFIDEAQSARNDNRPEFNNMIGYVTSRSNTVAYIITDMHTRYARNSDDAGYWRKILRKHDVKIIAADNPIDENNAYDVFMRTVLEGVAQLESSNNEAYVRSRTTQAVREGKCVGGVTPLGLKINQKTRRYEIDEEYAHIISKMFTDYLNGKDLKEIARDLNQSGYTGVRKTPFDREKIMNHLTNQKYIGSMTYNLYANYRKKPKKMNIEPVIVENAFPAIISKDIFRKVQDKLISEKPRNNYRRMKSNEVFYFTGKIFCGECGEMLTGYSTHKINQHGKYYNYSQYRCKGKRNKKCDLPQYMKNDIEKKILDTCKHNFFTEKSIELFTSLMMEKLKGYKTPTEKDKIKLITLISEYKKKQERLLDLFLSNSINKAGYDKKKYELDQQINAFENELSSHEKLNLITLQRIRKMFSLYKNILSKTNNGDDIIEFVNSTIDKIVIFSDGSYQISLLFPLFADKNGMATSTLNGGGKGI